MLVFLRLALFHFLFYAGSVLCCFIILPFFFLPRRVMHGFSRFWSWMVLQGLKYIVQLTYDCQGMENIPPSACLIASQHQSMWDTIALNYLLPDANIVAKRELFWIPLFGWGMWKAGIIPVDRGSGPAALRRLLRRAQDHVRLGRKIIIFPEGTRAAPGQHIDYKPGIAALYKNLSLPCVPVALNSGFFWPRRSLMRRAGCLQIRFLPPIQPGLDRHDFMKKLRAEIEKTSLSLAPKIRQ